MRKIAYKIKKNKMIHIIIINEKENCKYIKSFSDKKLEEIKDYLNKLKEFKPSPSLIRKEKMIKKLSEAPNSPVNVLKTSSGVVDLVDKIKETYPYFDRQEAINKMISPYKNDKDKIVKPQRHISIIGLFILAKKIEIISEEQLVSVIKRNVKSANSIKAYPFKRIIETMKFLKDKADFKWTIETVAKFIDEDLKKTNLNLLGKKSSGKVLGEDVKIKD